MNTGVARLGEYLIKRRIELGNVPRRVLMAKGPSAQTWHKIETGKSQRVQIETQRQIELAVGWLPGSCAAIMSGGEPVLDLEHPLNRPSRLVASSEAPDTAVTIRRMMNEFLDGIEAAMSQRVPKLFVCDLLVDVCRLYLAGDFRGIVRRDTPDGQPDELMQRMTELAQRNDARPAPLSPLEIHLEHEAAEMYERKKVEKLLLTRA